MKSRIMGVLVALGVFSMTMFGSIDFHAFHLNYYENSYAKLETAKGLGMSEEALNDATHVLLSYIKDQRDDLHCVHEVWGVEREIFNEREVKHMVDVKHLYLNARMICLSIGGIGLMSLAVLFFRIKRKKMTMVEMLSDLKNGFYQVVLAFLIVIGFLLFYAFVDFERFWTVFHQIFFRNDLWLLDPRTSIMINMFPQEFFFGMVMRIAFTFIVSFSLISGCVVWFLNRCKKVSIEKEIK